MRNLKLLVLMITTSLTLIAQEVKIETFAEKLEFNELVDLADHRLDLIEYGSNKLRERGYSWRRTIYDGELGTRVTFLAWASKIELQKSHYLFEDGTHFEIMYNIEFGNSSFNQVEEDHFNKVLNEIRLAGFEKINSKNLNDGTELQLLNSKDKNISILLTSSPETKYILLGDPSGMQYRFDNSLVKECCNPMLGCH